MRSLLQWLALINDKMLEINGVKDKLAIHPMKFNYFFLTGDAEYVCEGEGS